MAETISPCVLSNATPEDTSVRNALETEASHSLKDFILKHACLIEELFKRMQRVEGVLRLHGNQDVIALGSQPIQVKSPHVLQDTANGRLQCAAVYSPTSRNFTPPRLIGLGAPVPLVQSQSGPPPAPPVTRRRSAHTAREASPRKPGSLVVPPAAKSARSSAAILKGGGKPGAIGTSRLASSATVATSCLPTPAAQRQPSPLRSVRMLPSDVGGGSDKGKTSRSHSQPVASACTNGSTGVQTWEVVYGSGVNVRCAKDPSSLVIGCKSAGTIVCGRQEGDWLALAGEPGFMLLSSGVTCLLRQVPAKLHLASGNVPSACSPSKSSVSSPSRPDRLRCFAVSTTLSTRANSGRPSVAGAASMRSHSAPLRSASPNRASPRAVVAPGSVPVSVQHGHSSRLEYNVSDATGVRSFIIEVVNGKLVHSSTQGGHVVAREVTSLTWSPLPDGSIVAFDQLDGAWPVPACHTGKFTALANLARVPIRLGEAKSPAFVPESIATVVPTVIPEGISTVAPRASLNALCGLSPRRKPGIGHASPSTTASNTSVSMLGPTMAAANSQSRAPVKMHTATESQGQLPETNAAETIQLHSSELGASCGVGSIRSPVLPSVSDEASEAVPSLNQRVLDSAGASLDTAPSPSGSARLDA